MYDKLPKWITQPCPKEYGYNLEPEEIKTRVKEAIKNGNDLLANLRYGDSFCIHVDKVPMAKSNDIRTFTTFTEAKKLLAKAQQTYKGKNVGLGFGLFGPFCGIDIDHCVNEDGIISDTASRIMDMFDGAYMEMSPSGTGVHIIFHTFTKYQKGYQKYFTKMNAEACKANGFPDIGGLEFYQGFVDSRYLTLTGNCISPGKDNNHTFGKEKIEKFLETYMFKPQPTAPVTPPVEFDSSDDEDKAWFYWALFNNRGRLQELYSKEATGSGATESEDDIILLQEIALWCNFNPSVMDRAFSLSKNDFINPVYSKMWFYGKDFYFDTKDEEHKDKWLTKSNRHYSKISIPKAIDYAKANGKQATKVFFKDSFYYDEESKTIKPKTFDEGGNDMRKLEVSTRVSQKGSQVVCLNTKSFKIETAMPQPKKDSTEETVQWVSIYKKGSNEPSVFLDRNKDQALFELASAITLKEFGKED